MNASTLTRNYACLTPEERFRLILAAVGRGDASESHRLQNASGRVAWSVPDCARYAFAFEEVAMRAYMELLAVTTTYLLSLEWFGSHPIDEDLGEIEDDDQEGGEGDDGDQKAEEESAGDDDGEPLAWEQDLQLALAGGFILRTKAEGWKLFCERLNVPPFLFWESLPGFNLVQRALERAEILAFEPEGMLRWANAVRTAGEPELTEVPLTAEREASKAENFFRQRVQRWGG